MENDWNFEIEKNDVIRQSTNHTTNNFDNLSY